MASRGRGTREQGRGAYRAGHADRRLPRADRPFPHAPRSSHHHVGGRHRPIMELVLDFARAIKVPVRSQDDVARASGPARQGPHDRITSSATPEPEAYWTAERVMEHLAGAPGGATEFMTHPGYYDDDLGVQPLRQATRDRARRAERSAGARDDRAARNPAGPLRELLKTLVLAFAAAAPSGPVGFRFVVGLDEQDNQHAA